MQDVKNLRKVKETIKKMIDKAKFSTFSSRITAFQKQKKKKRVRKEKQMNERKSC